MAGYQLGDYEIVKTLAQGGMGTVYLARQLKLAKREVAIKVIRFDRASKGLADSLEQEKNTLSQLDHKYIAQIYDAGLFEHNGCQHSFFAMAYVKGPTLAEYSKQTQSNRRDLLNLLIKLCEGVQYAHGHNIRHGDLKPANVMLDEQGDPRIVDFGMACMFRETPAAGPDDRVSEHVGGTLPYMSPEQTRIGSGQIDARADVYALGVIAYEMLAGHRPFAFTDVLTSEALLAIQNVDPPPLSTVDPQLAGDLEAIVAKAMSKDRDARYETAAELGNDLRHYLHNEPVEAMRPWSFRYRCDKWLKRYRGIAGIAVAGLIVLLFIGGYASWQQRIANTASHIADEEISKNERINRRTQYVGDIRRAWEAWDAGRIGLVHDMLTTIQRGMGLDYSPGMDTIYLARSCLNGRNCLFTDRRPVRCLALSRDEMSIAVALDKCSPRDAHGMLVGKVQDSPARSTPVIWLVDLAENRRRAELVGHTSPVLALAFSTDGAMLASAGEDAEIRIWNTSDGRPLAVLKGHTGGILALQFCTRDSRLVSVSYDRTLRVWDTNGAISPKTIAIVDDSAKVKAAAFGLSGDCVAVADQKGTIKLRDLQGRVLKEFNPTPALQITSLACSPDDHYVLAGTRDGIVLLFSVATGKEQARYKGHDGALAAACFVGNDVSFATAGSDRTVRIWQMGTPQESVVLRGHISAIYSVVSSRRANLLLTGSGDASVRTWNLAEETTPRGSSIGHDLLGICHNRAGDKLFLFTTKGTFSTSAHLGQRATRWITMSDGSREEWGPIGSDAVFTFVSPNSPMLAALGADRKIRIWDSDLRAVKATIPITSGLAGHPSCLCDPQGNLAAVFDREGTVDLWDLATERKYSTVKTSVGLISSTAFQDDGSHLAVFGTNRKMQMYDVRTTTLVADWKTDQTVTQAAFDHGGDQIVCCDNLGGVRVISVDTGRQTARLEGPSVRARHVVFDPQDKLLLLGGGDGTLLLWDLLSSQEIARIAGDGPIDYLSVSPNSKHLMVSYQHGRIKLYNLTQCESDLNMLLRDIVTDRESSRPSPGSSKPQCDDGLDNDLDGLIDSQDPSCKDRNDNNEWPYDPHSGVDR